MSNGTDYPAWIGAIVSAGGAGYWAFRTAKKYFNTRTAKVGENDSRWTVVFGAAAQKDSNGNIIAPARDGLVQRLLRLEGEFDTHTFHPPGEKGGPSDPAVRGEHSSDH